MPMDRMTALVEVPSTDWEELCTGKTYLAIQLRSAGVVFMHLQGSGDSPPDADAGFITLARGVTGTESAFSAGGLPENTTVWVKAAKGTEQISAIAY